MPITRGFHEGAFRRHSCAIDLISRSSEDLYRRRPQLIQRFGVVGAIFDANCVLGGYHDPIVRVGKVFCRDEERDTPTQRQTNVRGAESQLAGWLDAP